MRHATLALLASATLLGSGCAATKMTPAEQELSETMGAEAFQPSTRAMRDGIETQPILAQATFWQREYELNPGDLEAAIKLASAVRRMGNPEQAIEITQTTRALYPKDPYLVAEYAAALVSAERGSVALPVLETALRTAPGYARLWSLRGAALDQSERYDEARQSYGRALSITPYDPNILANMGLSFALQGDAATAEEWLVKAASIPGASESVTRNLDLVRQLQGKTPAPASRSAERAPTLPTMSVPAAPTAPGRNFRVFEQGEAMSAADAARQMARQGGNRTPTPAPQTRAATPPRQQMRPMHMPTQAKPLRAGDPDALARLARNTSPMSRAQAPRGMQGVAPQSGSPFAPQPQGQMGAPASAPMRAPQPGYPAAYPQGASPYPQVQPNVRPQSGSVALPRGRARPRR